MESAFALIDWILVRLIGLSIILIITRLVYSWPRDDKTRLEPTVTNNTRMNPELVKSPVKLNGENFREWRLQMEDLLHVNGLGHITKGEVRSNTLETYARAVLRSHLEPKLLDLVLPDKPAHQSWTKIVDKFTEEDDAKQMTYYNELVNTKLESLEHHESHFNRLDELLAKYRGTGGTGLEGKAAAQLYLSSVSTLAQMDSQLTHLQRERNLTIDKVKSATRQQYNNVKERSTSVIACIKTDKRDGSGEKTKLPQGCFLCRKTDHFVKECPDMPPGYCYHFKRRRIVPIKTKQGYISAVGEGHRSEDQLVDSAATGNYYGNRALFETLKEYPGGQVQVANKGLLDVIGIGQVRIKGSNGEVVLQNVKFVPDLSCNVISVSELRRAGYEVHFDDTPCIRSKSTGQVVLRMKEREDGLYPVITGQINCTTNPTWHQKLGHATNQNLKILSEKTPEIEPDKPENCDTCIAGKMKQRPYPPSNSRANYPLERLHLDICVATQGNIGYDGSKYFLQIVDDYSRYTEAIPIKSRTQVMHEFNKFKVLWENQLGERLKKVKTDNAAEFTGGDFQELCTREGILHELSVPYCHQTNGRAERHIQKTEQIAVTLLEGACMPLRYWSEAVRHASLINNVTPHKGVNNMTPYELFRGAKFRYQELHIFGSLAYNWMQPEKRDKFQTPAERLIFVGFDQERGARLLDPNTRRIIISSNFRVIDGKFPFCKATPDEDTEVVTHTNPESTNDTESDPEGTRATSHELLALDEPDVESTDMSDTEEEGETCYTPHTEMEPATSSIDEHEPSDIYGELYGDTRSEDLGRGHRTRRPNPRYYGNDYINIMKQPPTTTIEPQTYKEALNVPQSHEWINAMNDEMTQFRQLNVFQAVKRMNVPAGKKLITTRWKYTLKRRSDNSIEKFKARLVARGFSQEPEIDYTDTFAPVATHATFRTILTIAAHRDWEVHHWDIKTAFLYADLEEELYVEPPEGFAEPDEVWLLKKSLYGLKQAPNCWNKKITEILLKYGLTQSKADQSLFFNESLIVMIYVDDILVTAKSDEELLHCFNHLQEHVEVKDLGQVSRYLGMRVTRSRKGFLIDQEQYISKLAEELNISSGSRDNIPLPSGIKPLLQQTQEPLSDHPVRKVIGSLMYLTITRPDIQSSVSLVSRFMHKPTKQLWRSILSIARYLIKTKELKLKLDGEAVETIWCYTDSDYANDHDRKSQSGHVIMLGKSPVLWQSKKQNTVALSTTEAETIAMTTGVTDALWLKTLLEELNLTVPVIVLGDNKPSTQLANNQNSSQRSKHLEIRMWHLRDLVTRGIIVIKHIPGTQQIADALTKPLPRQFDISTIGLVRSQVVC